MCPENSFLNNNICIDKDLESCIMSENEIDLYEFLSSGSIDFNAKQYAKEFNYTNNHVSHYYNSVYSILIYKDVNCIDKLLIDAPKIDFGDCYNKIQNNLSPPSNNSIIVALIEKFNINKKSTVSYNFYHPDTGDLIDADSVCKDDEIIIKENVISQLNESNVNLKSVLFLTEQNVDIFDLSSAFYNDICYHFESPNGRDIPVKERIHIYYPNITLCDAGCSNQGVNLTTMESKCECKFNLLKNDLVEGNALLENTIGEITDILSNSNLDVLKCFKNAFNIENISKGIGGFIIIGILFIQIFFSFKFLLYDINQIIRYLYNLAEKFINYNDKKNKNIKKLKTNNFSKESNPPPKKNNIDSRQTILGSEDYRSTNTLKRRKTERLKLSKKCETKPDKNNKIILKKNKDISIYKKSNKDSLECDNNICLNSNESKEIEEYLKENLDEMDFDDAIKKDKRPFCEYFIEKLKTNQMIGDTFFNKNNIRPFPIKFLLFLLNIDLYFVINGLFFSEEYIMELFTLEKEDKFFDFFPRSISRFFYATFVGAILDIIIGCIFIEENKVKRIFLRDKDNKLQIRYEISLIINSIKKRYKIFIVICIFISVISWYYVSCFNNVYPGVKMEWIKSSIVIIIIMQLLSCLIVLLESLLRLLSFQLKSERIFNFKKILS